MRFLAESVCAGACYDQTSCIDGWWKLVYLYVFNIDLFLSVRFPLCMLTMLWRLGALQASNSHGESKRLKAQDRRALTNFPNLDSSASRFRAWS